MARKSESQSAIEEIEGAAERMAAWVQQHAVPVTVAVVLVLAAGGGWGLYSSAVQRREAEASAAVEAVRADYLSDMGAPPGAIQVPELANPDAARRIRDEYAERYRQVADEHEGTTAAALARLEMGELLAEGGEESQGLEVWKELLESLPGDSKLVPIVLQRIGRIHEDAGRWAEAAASHEQAASFEAFPLRYLALADAARCYAEAGDRDRALELFDRIEVEAPDLQLPDHLRIRVRELRAYAAR